MQQHKLPSCLWWSIQAGRALHQRAAWINLAREYKAGHHRYDHAIRYAKMAHREYRRLIDLALQSFSNDTVDIAARSVKQFGRFSKTREGSPIQPR